MMKFDRVILEASKKEGREMKITLNAIVSTASCLFLLNCGQDASLNQYHKGSGSASRISDGAHSGGNEHFYFLPPLVASPGPAGVFDGTLSPRLEICLLAEGNEECEAGISPIAIFTTEEGSGSETVRVNLESELYIANWHTDQYTLEVSRQYRILVFVGDQLLGYADVLVANSNKDLKDANTQEVIPLLDGKTLPIKVRIEAGAVSTDPSPIGHWDFNESGGGIVTDRSGNGRHGGVVGSDTRTPGREGNALIFNGATHVEIPNAPAMQLSNSTFAVWMKRSADAQMPIYEFAQPGSRAGYHTWVNTSGNSNAQIGAIQTNYGPFNGEWQYYFTGSGLVAEGTWTHIAVTYEAATSVGRIYIDGNQVASAQMSSGFVPVLHSILYLGWRPDYSPEGLSNSHLQGEIDDLKIFDTVLTPEEIGQLAL
jgi:hypothetical protein